MGGARDDGTAGVVPDRREEKGRMPARVVCGGGGQGMTCRHRRKERARLINISEKGSKNLRSSGSTRRRTSDLHRESALDSHRSPGSGLDEAGLPCDNLGIRKVKLSI